MPNFVTSVLSKPEVAIRADSDPNWLAVRSWKWRKFSEDALGGDAPDLIPAILGKPEIAVRASHDLASAFPSKVVGNVVQ